MAQNRAPCFVCIFNEGLFGKILRFKELNLESPRVVDNSSPNFQKKTFVCFLHMPESHASHCLLFYEIVPASKEHVSPPCVEPPLEVPHNAFYFFVGYLHEEPKTTLKKGDCCQ